MARLIGGGAQGAGLDHLQQAQGALEFQDIVHDGVPCRVVAWD